MSAGLSAVAKTEFDTEVKHAYQGMKTLRECVTSRLNVTGDKYDFRVMGKGAATTRTGSAADVVPMGVAHSLKVATLVDYEAPEYTDIYDAKTVNFDEVVELATTIAGAMGRRDDQSIIDAMSAGGTSVDKSTASLTTPLLVLTDASKRLNAVEAPMEDRYFVCDETFIYAMLNTTTITSADYNSVKLLMSGEVDSFMGFKFKKVGTRVEGGMPGSTGASQAYFWHKPAIGLAISIDLKTTIDWVATKTSWLANGIYRAGCVAREPQGIVRIIYDETA